MDWDQQTIKEWKELGFYYQRDDDLKQWWIIGSKSGLSDFLTKLLNFANTPPPGGISEEIHLGPHQYLEIMIWHIPLISSHCIGGSLSDLKQLKTIIEHKLLNANEGETFDVGSDYTPQIDYSIKFFVMADGFDPSSIEFSKE